MKTKQNIVGARTEQKIANYFKEHRYWALIVPKGINGQPFDIIARRKNFTWFVDAKHLESDKRRFPFDRIEPNQITSMSYAYRVSEIDGRMGFIIDWCDELYYFDFKHFLELKEKGKKSVIVEGLQTLDDQINADAISDFLR